MRKKIFLRCVGHLFLLVFVLSIVSTSVLAVAWSVPGYVLGPAADGASVNIIFYDNATGNYITDTLVTSNAQGEYIWGFVDINDVLYPLVDVVSIANKGDATGTNNEYSYLNTTIGTPGGEWQVNVTMSHPLILTGPNNNSYFNYNYTNFTWEYVNFSQEFRLQIDTDENFANPLNLNVSNLPGNLTGNFSNYSMIKDQSLSDNTYYWRVLSYNDTIPAIFDISSVYTFVIDTVAPLITGYNPLNNSWINNPYPELILTTNENANCLGNNSSGEFLLKSDYFGGTGTTSHNFTLNLTNMSGEGPNTYYVQCNDTAGNVGIEEFYTINLDTFAPNTTSNFSTNNTWINSPTVVTLQEDDPVPSSGLNWTHYCITESCNPGPGINYTGEVLIETEGQSFFSFASSDLAENVQVAEELVILIDTEAPNTTDNFSQAGEWINYNAEVTLSPEDPNSSSGDGSGLSWTNYCFSSEIDTCNPGTNYVGTVTISDENLTTFRYHSQDNVANQQAVQTVIVKVDKTKPVTSTNFTSNGTWVNSSQDIYLVPNDTIDGRNVSGLNWTRYCTTDACNPQGGSDYDAGPITILTEGASVFRFASSDNASNIESTVENNILIDTEAPNTTDNFSYDNVWINFDAEITLFPEDPNASLGNGSGLNWTKYCYSPEGDCTPDIEYVSTVTISDENISYFRYYSQDNVSNTQDIQTIIVKIDKTSPLHFIANVQIDGGVVYSTDMILDFTWVGFSDITIGKNFSGIGQFYYNLTNNEETIGGALDYGSPGQIIAETEGNQTIFVWAGDNVSVTGPNIGLAVNSSIFVDTIGPQYTLINQTNVTEDSANSNFTSTINITEDGSGHAFTPMYRYRYNQSDSYSEWENLTFNNGNEYQLGIEAPAWGWNMNRFQNLSFQINTTDLAGNENISEEFLELIDSINDAPVLDLIENQTVSQGNLLTFNVTGSDIDNDTLEAVTLIYSVNETNLTTLKINNTLFEVNWTPGNEYVGENYVNFTLSDGELIDSQEVLINVSNVNDPPILAEIPNMTAYENTSFSQDINATDADLNVLTYYDNTSLFEINSSDGTFNFTPVNGDVGNHSVEFNVSDGSGGQDYETITLEIIDVFSEINFSLLDRIFSTVLDNATLTGGDSCSSDCEFNDSIFRYQTNGNIEFNLTAIGYSLNNTVYSISSNQNYTILLEDAANPSISSSNIAYFINDSNGFYLNISVNASDNLDLENVSFDYSIDAHNSSIIDTSGISNMTYLQGSEYSVVLGPYAYSFDLTSNQTALDYYENSNTSLNDLRVYLYVTNGSGSPAVNSAPVLAAIGNLTATVEKVFTETVVGADAEGDALTYAENTSLFIIDSSGGNFTFTPNSSQVGNYTVHFNVSDGALIDEETINFEIITSICGDQFCSSSETCTSCSADCGSCPSSSSSSSSSSSGGGGGGGSRRTVIEYVNQTVIEEVNVETIVVVNETCVNNFTCFDWEPVNCTSGEIQERSCYDVNNCTDFVLIENQSCIGFEVDLNVYIEEPIYEKFFLFSFFENLAGNAWQSTKKSQGPALFTVLGLLLIGILAPIVLLKINSKTYTYEISDLHAIIDGHEIHIRSSVAANTNGTKGNIMEQWESDVDNYIYESKIAKV